MYLCKYNLSEVTDAPLCFVLVCQDAEFTFLT